MFLQLAARKDDHERLLLARQACMYAVALMFFFLLFGTLILRLFGIPLSMVRIVGGIILTRLGFMLFHRGRRTLLRIMRQTTSLAAEADVAFVPLAMPIMFGPGAIATILGMTSLVRHAEFEVAAFIAICAAILAAMLVTYMVLRTSRIVLAKIGLQGIDAATRIVGFFVSAMGVGLIFHGVIEALQTYGLATGH